MHEPLLSKFRDHKSLAKKVARSLGRGEVGDAARFEKKTPRLSLDHIIKERYPTFVDALRDLDDALSLLSLFANLPSTSTVPPKTIALCQRLCLEFQHYLILTHTLRKSFLSIKGIYYQATIQGQDILWLVPYKFVQRVTGDVDFRIMGTFVEFYTTLLGFVNFRLYNTIGLVYPPKLDVKNAEEGAELGALRIEGKGIREPEQDTQRNGDATILANGSHTISSEMENQIANIPIEGNDEDRMGEALSAPVTEAANENIDSFQPIAPDADSLLQPQKSSDEISNLFARFTFYLSRETPRQPLEFLLRAFGCTRIGWDKVLGPGAFTHVESDPSITHQVVDRPPVTTTQQDNDAAATSNGTSTGQVKPGYQVPGRTYIQPQWVWDCANEVKLLRPDFYAPGATMPPHLSPWVKPSKGQYDPTAPLAEQEREGEAVDAEEEEEEKEEAAKESGLEREESEQTEELVEGEDEETKLPRTHTDDETHGMDITLGDDVSDSDDPYQSNQNAIEASDDFSGFDSFHSSDDDQPAPSKSLHQLELEAEAAGHPPPPTATPLTKPTPSSFTPSISTSLSSASPNRNTGLKSILKTTRPNNSDHPPSTSPPTSTSTTTSTTITNAMISPDIDADAVAIQAAQRARRLAKAAEAEELERRKMMLPRKKRKMYEKMAYGVAREEAKAKGLRAKRRRIESVAAASGSRGRG